MKNHELTKYEPTTRGYKYLMGDDQELARASRNVAMTFLEQHYHSGTDKERADGFNNLFEVANLAGFKLRAHKYYKNGEMKFRKRFPSYRDATFYNELFARFENEVRLINYDPEDEYGLADESVKIANIALKYKRIIALRIKRKNIFEKITLYFTNNLKNN